MIHDILEITLSQNAAMWIAGFIFALGGNYWLLVHIGNEGKKIKDKVNNHAEMHVEHRESLKRVEQKIDNVAERVSDLKEILRK